MTHTDIIKKLIGPIFPSGKSEVDKERLINLNNMCTLTMTLLLEIEQVAKQHKDSYEHSVKTAGECADSFIQQMRELLCD